MDVAIKVLYGILPENQPYIKDIYDKLEDAQEQHPHDLIAVGYCIADPRTGYVIDEDYEWFPTYGDAMSALAELNK